MSVEDPGEGPGGAVPPPFFQIKLRPEGPEKKKLRPPPATTSYIRVWMTGPVPRPLSDDLDPQLSLPLTGPCQKLKNPGVEGCIRLVLCEVRSFTLAWLIFIFNIFLWRQVTTHFYTFLFASSLFLKPGAITVLGIPSPDKLQDAFTTSTDGPNSNL